MGAIAKKAIGITATAAAAAIVRMFIEKAKVESVSHDDVANNPARNRRPIAEASAMMNPITLLRWRCNIGLLDSKLTAVIGMKSPRDVRIGESPSLQIRRLQSGCGSELPKKCRPALRCVTLGKVKRAVLR